MTRLRRLVAALLACAILLVSASQSRAGDAPGTPDPSRTQGQQEVREALAGWLKFEKNDDPPANSLWRRYGISPGPSLVGDLPVVVMAARRAWTLVDNRLSMGRLEKDQDHPCMIVEIVVGGVAPHRTAHVMASVGSYGQRYDVLFVEEDGWRVVRADRLAFDPVQGTFADAPGLEARRAAAAAAEELWKSIDAYDLKAFSAWCGEWKNGKVVDSDAKGLEAMLTEFHQKYGLRARRVLKPIGFVGPAGEVDVPVLIGDREVLLLCGMRQDAKGNWRLTRVSDGDPSSFEDEKPAEKPAEPAMGETPPAPQPPKKDETPPR